MSVHEISHPLVKHKIGLMRASDRSTRSFRQLAGEVGNLLTYEATKDLELEDYTLEGWCGEITAQRIRGKKITVVPILRAGPSRLSVARCPTLRFVFSGPPSFDLPSLPPRRGYSLSHVANCLR